MLLISRFLGTKPRHSLEHFTYTINRTLHTDLTQMLPCSAKNKDKVIESIRAISEELI